MSRKTTIKPLKPKKTSAILTTHTNATANATAITPKILDTRLNTAAVTAAKTTATPSSDEPTSAVATLYTKNSSSTIYLRKKRRQRPCHERIATNLIDNTPASRTKTTLTTATQPPQKPLTRRPFITHTFRKASSSLTAAFTAALLHTTNATTATLNAANNAAAASLQTYAASNAATLSSSFLSPATTVAHIPPSLSIDSHPQYPMAVLDGSLAQIEPNATTTNLLHNTVISTATSAFAAAATANTTLLLDDDGGGGSGAGGAGLDASANGDWFDDVILALKAFVMLFIIIAAIFGNLLVIISVMRVRKLRK